MDLNKAMEELEEIKSSESFEEYLSNNREEIYKLLKAKSEELIESGVSDIKEGIMDYFMEILEEKAHGCEDAYRTIYILTDGGRGVDFDSHLDIPEDSDVAGKLVDAIEVCNKIKNPDLQTVGKNNVNQINWSLYLSDFGFSKTKLIIFSTFSR